MMQGIDAQNFRLRLGADPSDPALAAEAMALGGGAQEQLRQAQAFEQALAAALAVPIPAQLQQQLAQITAAPSAKTAHWFNRGPWLALAASLLLVIGFAASTLLRPPADSVNALGIAAIEHLTHEPFALMRTEVVAEERLAGLLREAGLDLSQPIRVNYASPCPVYGQKTLHMVVQQPSGPVSVIYFPEAEMAALGDFRYGATQGKAVAYGDGMLVLLGTDGVGIQAVEGMWQAARVATNVRTQQLAANG